MAQKDEPNRETTGKVGSDPKAARKVGGPLDFGTPADQATAETSREARDFPGIDDPQHLSRSGSASREHGVGSNEGEAGHGSAGDIDTDFTGVSGSTVSARPVKGHQPGPDDTTGSSDDFASGGPAKGDNRGNGPAPGQHVGNVIPIDPAAEVPRDNNA